MQRPRRRAQPAQSATPADEDEGAECDAGRFYIGDEDFDEFDQADIIAQFCASIGQGTNKASSAQVPDDPPFAEHGMEFTEAAVELELQAQVGLWNPMGPSGGGDVPIASEDLEGRVRALEQCTEFALPCREKGAPEIRADLDGDACRLPSFGWACDGCGQNLGDEDTFCDYCFWECWGCGRRLSWDQWHCQRCRRQRRHRRPQR